MGVWGFPEKQQVTNEILAFSLNQFSSLYSTF